MKFPWDIPKHIHELVRNNPFTSDADELMICRDAYPDEKIAQSFRDERISDVFKRLNTTDAQVIVVRVK